MVMLSIHNRQIALGLMVIISPFLLSSQNLFSGPFEERYICVDVYQYPIAYSFFKQLIEKHPCKVQHVLCVQSMYETQSLKHHEKILCVPQKYVDKIESGDHVVEEYIEEYVCAEMSKYYTDTVVRDVTYHALGLIGVYLIATRYLDYAIPILALGGIGYLARMRR